MLKASIKNACCAALLACSALAQAAPSIVEQVLPTSGGDSVAIDGEWGFVGDVDDCQVYVYKYDYITNLWGDGAGSNGVPYTELRTTGSCNTAAFGGFGASISTSHGLLAVGAPLAKSGGNKRYGKIFFYQYDPAQTGNGTGGWVQKTAIGFPLPADQQNNSAYGATVSVRYLAGKALLGVGAPLYDGVNGTNAGKAFLYEWDEATDAIVYINAVEGEAASDQFGKALTSNGLHFLVGAPFHDSGAFTDNGAAYLYSYDVVAGTITQQQKIDATTPLINTLADHNMGLSVSLSPGADSVMLLGGDVFGGGARQLKLINGTYEYADSLTSTLGGDVSQDGDTAGFGYIGRSVQLYYDKQDLAGSSDWKYTKIETDYGRDISVSGSRVMVNGNDAPSVGGSGVAYAYYTSSCYNGGTLKANEWTMIGLQCDTSAASTGGLPATIGEIFVPDLGTYDTNWVMYKQNGTDYEGHQNAYVKLGEQDVIVQGQGYWIIVDANVSWSIPAAIGDPAKQTPVVVDPNANQTSRATTAAVHRTDVKSMLSSLILPTVGDINEDIRVMFSNPFTAPMEWTNALMGLNSYLNVGALQGFFENDDTSAYVYKTGVGTQNGYMAISATPGFTRKIEPGEGFFIRFSDEFHTDILNNAGATELNLMLPLAK